MKDNPAEVTFPPACTAVASSCTVGSAPAPLAPGCAAHDLYSPDLPTSELLAEISGLIAVQRRSERLICRYLADRVEARADRQLGCYSSVQQAAFFLFGLGPKATRERVRIGRALRRLSAIEQAFINGELAYSRVREMTRVATTESEFEWLGLARQVDMRALERAVAQASAARLRETRDGRNLHRTDSHTLAEGETAEPETAEPETAEGATPHKVRFTIELSADNFELLRQALQAAKKASASILSDADALAVIANVARVQLTEHSQQGRRRECGSASGRTACEPTALVNLEALQASRVLAMVQRGRWRVDDLCEASGLPVATINVALLALELSGKVRRRDGRYEPVKQIESAVYAA